MGPKEFEVPLGVAARFTTDTLDQQVRAVQFHQAIGTGARQRVQAIDVLRHDHQDFARFFEGHDGSMNGVRPRVPKAVPPFQLVIPMFDPRCF
jgi:hypothetical protein